MLRSRFWLQNQDFGVSVGAIGMVFRARHICSDRSLGAQMGGGVEYFRGVDGEGRVAKILAGHAGSRKFQKGVNVVTVSGATCRATPG